MATAKPRAERPAGGRPQFTRERARPAAGAAKPVALVTGAGARLGRAMAEWLAASGHDVVLHALRSAREAEELAKGLRAQGTRVAVLRADLADPRAVARLAGAAGRAFGKLDVLINNAAIFRASPPERLTARELDDFLAVNLRAPFVLSAEIGKRMKARGGGLIVNLACLSALRPWQDCLPYSISKAGLTALTVGLAKLLAPEVRVNAIAPGILLPPEGTSRRRLARLTRRIPARRIGAPEDLLSALRYLLDSPYVTGQVLRVDGGRSIN